MNHTARALVLSALGGVTFRIGVTDEWANYVNDWMRWPLVVSGVLLIALAFVVILTSVGDHEHDHDRASAFVPWLLVLPVVVGFVIQPPALGAYVADRRANQADARTYADPAVAPLSETGENEMPVSSFVARASYDRDGLADVTVRLTGFVSTDSSGWYVTRLAISCCAADGAAFRVRVEDADAPPEEQWVTVVGTWVEGTGTRLGDTPTITATEVAEVDEPEHPYE
ncbi:TIGR03943 family putative permease subunit [Nocardioides bizhenqiangii]|uniref:TIGR03943 family protein n=1 Tax=Nocardioides bizhenqiangii TaxID=3095076 RepID=A0ABZ0ZPY8_9ACTN|nr:TIGR03943 family protein [Nocardioides sp. HM61]WQQ26380.1 TIGR03943 family protein [Nocardioides sp. HM61]